MFVKRDPGPCPIDGTPHTACCAPGPDRAIVAGRITPATAVIVPSAPAPAAPPVTDAPPAPAFSTGTYRGKRARPPAPGA